MRKVRENRNNRMKRRSREGGKGTFFHSSSPYNDRAANKGMSTPTANGYSIVLAREITGTRAKSLCVRIDTDPGSCPAGNVAGHDPHAPVSVICSDKISDATFNGDIEFFVNMKKSEVHAGAGKETLHPSQETDPRVKMIREHKLELIDCLAADRSFILQHAHAKALVSDRQYQKMKHAANPEETVIDLIDWVISGGPESCARFLDVLDSPEILETYPRLRQMVLRQSGSSA